MKIGRLEIDLMADVARLSKDMREAKNIVQGFARDTHSMINGMRAAFAAVGVGVLFRELVLLTDQYTKYNAQLRLATKTEAEYIAARAEVSRIARDSQADLAATGTLYARISNATRELGKTQQDVSRITQAVTLSLRVSGATQQEAASATLQLSQAFGAGALRGEEFNAVNEAAPRLMRALADGMGVPIGALREMAKEGKITAAVMAEALPLALVQLQQEAMQIETIGGSFVVLRNTIMEMVGAQAEASGFIKMMSLAMQAAAKDAELWTSVTAGVVEILRIVTVLVGNAAVVFRGLGDWVGSVAAQFAALAHGDLERVSKIGEDFIARRDERRKAYLEWEQSILGAGGAAKSAAKGLGELDQVERRMVNEGKARVRAVMDEAEARARAKKEAERAAKELAREQARLRDADAKGWVAYIEAQTKEYEDGLRDQARALDEWRKHEAKMRKLGDEEWVRKIDADVKEYERGLRDMAERQPSYIEAMQEQWKTLWGQISDVAAGFFMDLVMNGRVAFDNLKQFVKQMAAEMLALFAKRWILNMAAGGTFLGAAGNALAGGAGSDSLGGSLLNTAGSAILQNTTLGIGGAGMLSSAGSAMGAGLAATETGTVFATGALAGQSVGTGMMGGVYSALASIPVWGWIAMAVIAIGAWIAGNHKGGPKVGGSFFSDGGEGRFFTPNQGDSHVRDIVTQGIAGYEAYARAFGATPGNFGWRLGFDHDPNGTARSRVSAELIDPATGRPIYQNLDREMDDKEVPGQIALEMDRMFLAALRESDFGPYVNAIFDEAGDIAGMTAEEIDVLIKRGMEMHRIVKGLDAIGLKGLNPDTLQKFAFYGESVGQTFERFAQMWGSFESSFLSEARQLEQAQSSVTSTFATLGIAIPASKDAFYDLVRGLDLGTEAGRAMFTALMNVAPAFDSVSTAAAAMAMELEGLARRRFLRGGGSETSFLIDTFQGRHGWSTDMSDEQFIANLWTISDTDYARYNENDRRLIDAILDADLNNQRAIKGLEDTTARLNPGQESLRRFQESKEARQSLADNLIGSLTGPSSPLDPMQQLSVAEREFYALIAAAKSGDVTAIGKVGGARDALLQLAESAWGHSSPFIEIFNRTYDAAAPIALLPGINEQMLSAANRTASLTETSVTVLERISEESKVTGAAIAAAVGRVERAVTAVAVERR